tara:strand:- start:23 stop:268 length:246 start_codon:yes stop_codon:yes gene_type:complete
MADYPKGFKTLEVTREMIEADERFKKMTPKEQQKIIDEIQEKAIKLPVARYKDDTPPFFKMSKRYGGAVMKKRGGTFKGTF